MAFNNPIRTTVLSILTVLLFNGCDPAKLLVIKASPETHASVSVYINRKALPTTYWNGDKKVLIQLPATDTATYYEKRYYYSIGNWPNAEIAELAANIDSLVFTNPVSRLVLADRSQIEQYLLKHRSGYAGSVVTIEAK